MGNWMYSDYADTDYVTMLAVTLTLLFTCYAVRV